MRSLTDSTGFFIQLLPLLSFGLSIFLSRAGSACRPRWPGFQPRTVVPSGEYVMPSVELNGLLNLLLQVIFSTRPSPHPPGCLSSEVWAWLFIMFGAEQEGGTGQQRESLKWMHSAGHRSPAHRGRWGTLPSTASNLHSRYPGIGHQAWGSAHCTEGERSSLREKVCPPLWSKGGKEKYHPHLSLETSCDHLRKGRCHPLGVSLGRGAEPRFRGQEWGGGSCKVQNPTQNCLFAGSQVSSWSFSFLL